MIEILNLRKIYKLYILLVLELLLLLLVRRSEGVYVVAVLLLMTYLVYSPDNTFVDMCPELTNPENGKIHYVEPSQQLNARIAIFTCHDGYILFGPNTSVCLNNGHWSNKSPKCISQAVDLRGMKAFYQNILSIRHPITIMKTLNFNMYGLKVHVRSDVFMDEEFSVTVAVALEGSFQVPHETKLVSAVYYIETSSRLFKPIVLEIEHCVKFAETDSMKALTFGKVEITDNANPPYVFKDVSDGYFDKDSSSGSIETSTSHSLWGIFMVEEKYTVKYTVWPLVREVQQGHYKVHIVAFRNFKAQKMAIEQEYPKSEWSPLMKPFNFRFTNESKKLKLHISEEGEKKEEWLIEPLQLPEISKEDVDDDIGLCEMDVTWTGEPGKEERLKYFFSVDGINVHSFKIDIDP